MNPCNKPTCSRISATASSSLQEGMKNMHEGSYLLTNKLWLQSVTQSLSIVPLYPTDNAFRMIQGKFPNSSIPKMQHEHQTSLAGLSLGSTCLQLSEKVSLNSESAEDTMSQARPCPKTKSSRICSPCCHWPCCDNVQVTSSHCVSVPTLQVRKKNGIYHWNLNANIKSALQFHLPQKHH